MARTGKNKLISPSKTCLKMRQYRTNEHANICLGDAPKDPNGNPLGRRSKIDVCREIINRRTRAWEPVDDCVAHSGSHRLVVNGVMTTDPNAYRKI